MFENKKQKVISRSAFLRRQIVYSLYASLIIFFSLFIGIAGYMLTADLPFLDALLNASMILTGMGPVNTMNNAASKIFASLYALYSGVAFLSTIGVFLSPVIHRFMHKIHMDPET
jgi:hypothetical protein